MPLLDISFCSLKYQSGWKDFYAFNGRYRTKRSFGRAMTGLSKYLNVIAQYQNLNIASKSHPIGILFSPLSNITAEKLLQIP